jgi:hypothetical protein
LKNLLDTPLSNNAQIMLSIMTDMVFADEEGNTNFEVLGSILQKHLQVSGEEVEALTELFKANMREWAVNHPEYKPQYEASSFPKSLGMSEC